MPLGEHRAVHNREHIGHHDRPHSDHSTQMGRRRGSSYDGNRWGNQMTSLSDDDLKKRVGSWIYWTRIGPRGGNLAVALALGAVIFVVTLTTDRGLGLALAISAMSVVVIWALMAIARRLSVGVWSGAQTRRIARKGDERRRAQPPPSTTRGTTTETWPPAAATRSPGTTRTA
jgi:hypothetical protein